MQYQYDSTNRKNGNAGHLGIDGGFHSDLSVFYEGTGMK